MVTASDFYQQCVVNGVTDLKTAGKQEKARLIARRMGVAEADIIPFFTQEKEAADRIAAAENEKALAALRREEARKEQELSRGSEYFGREKRIWELRQQQGELHMKAKQEREAAAEKRRDAKESRQSADSYGQSAAKLAAYNKGSDWAILGGIADGIAGPAAGVATALSVQQSNAQRAAQNDSFIRSTASVMNIMREHAYDMEREANKHDEKAKELDRQKAALDNDISRANVALVGDTPADEILSMLSFGYTDISVSETGAFTVKVYVSLPRNNLLIYGDTPAVVDGTLLANLYQNKDYIGSAKLVLPAGGLAPGSRSVTLQGMGLAGAKPHAKCQIEFVPHKLWLIEKA